MIIYAVLLVLIGLITGCLFAAITTGICLANVVLKSLWKGFK